jgi:hypothetical protein
VGVERERDPANDADWFTRVDANVIAVTRP